MSKTLGIPGKNLVFEKSACMCVHVHEGMLTHVCMLLYTCAFTRIGEGQSEGNERGMNICGGPAMYLALTKYINVNMGLPFLRIFTALESV